MKRLEEFDRLRKRLTWAGLAMVLLITVGVLGYVTIAKGEHSVLDAIYMTVITLTTVGFHEIIDMTNDPGGRIFTMLILIFGMGIFAYGVPMLAAFMIEGHFLNIFARRRMEKQIQAMHDHYLVCGDSGSAWFVVEEFLRTSRPVVAIVPSEEVLKHQPTYLGDVPVIVGDPSDDEILMSAGVDRAAGIVASMDGDKDNVLVVFTARRLAPKARIIASAHNPRLGSKLRVAGADAVVSPHKIGGLRMASEMVRPAVVTFLDKMLRDEDAGLRVEEITALEGSKILGKTLGELKFHEIMGAVLLAIRPRGEDRFIFDPPRDRRIEAGMTFVLMINAKGREELARYVRL